MLAFFAAHSVIQASSTQGPPQSWKPRHIDGVMEQNLLRLPTQLSLMEDRHYIAHRCEPGHSLSLSAFNCPRLDPSSLLAQSSLCPAAAMTEGTYGCDDRAARGREWETVNYSSNTFIFLSRLVMRGISLVDTVQYISAENRQGKLYSNDLGEYTQGFPYRNVMLSIQIVCAGPKTQKQSYHRSSYTALLRTSGTP